MEITKVKDLGNSYLLNDSISVPKAAGNYHYQAIQEWIANGGTMEPEFTLAELKAKKLAELNSYHFSSTEIRSAKINNVLPISLSGEGRNLVLEQIAHLDQQIALGLKTPEQATFEYSGYSITLPKLKKLYVDMLDIVNTNYGIYRAHIVAINALLSIQNVQAYDFQYNYLKNSNIVIL